MFSDTLEERIAYAARIAAPVFQSNGWKYGGFTSGKSEVPTEQKLVETITHLVEALSGDSTSWSVSSGRFHVYRLMDEDGEWGPINISLELLDVRV